MRTAVTKCVAALVLALPAGCLRGSAARQEPVPAEATRAQSTAAAVLDAVQEANRVRARAGLRPLERDDALDRAAIDHVHELLRRRVLDHGSIDPQRATLALRLGLAGVTDWRMIAENLASLRNPHIGAGREIVRLWLDSPPHRTNLLGSDFDRVGTGIARAEDGTWYAVQVYAYGIATKVER